MTRFMVNKNTKSVYNFDDQQCAAKEYMVPMAESEESAYLANLNVKTPSKKVTFAKKEVKPEFINEREDLIAKAKELDVDIDCRWNNARIANEIKNKADDASKSDNNSDTE